MALRLPALALLVLAASGPASAQISTDRPGLGYSPSVVPRGAVQVEAGLPQAARERDEVRALAVAGPTVVTVSAYSFPVLLRYGLSDAVELRLGSSAYDVVDVAVDPPVDGADRTEGSAGLDLIEVGAKVQLATNGPVVAVLPSVRVPTVEYLDWGLDARTVAGWTLTDRLGLTTVLGASYTDDDPDGRLSAEAVASVGLSLADAVSVYGEVAAYPQRGATPVLAGGGLLVLVSPRVQLDASFDLGVTDRAPDLLFGAGASVRL